MGHPVPRLVVLTFVVSHPFRRRRGMDGAPSFNLTLNFRLEQELTHKFVVGVKELVEGAVEDQAAFFEH